MEKFESELREQLKTRFGMLPKEKDTVQWVMDLIKIQADTLIAEDRKYRELKTRFDRLQKLLVAAKDI